MTRMLYGCAGRFAGLMIRCAVGMGLLLGTLPTPPAAALEASRIHWEKPEDRLLHYWIDPAGFTAEQFDTIRANLAKATREWQDLCPDCGIEFTDTEDPLAATFKVVGVNVRGAFLANGFYPSDPPAKRILRVDRTYFSSKGKYDRIGILRHELGHILGYRHEQIVLDQDKLVACGWKTEREVGDAFVIALTDYDPASLMHYPCGVPSGPVLFEFSEKDIEGHRKLYRLPAWSGKTARPDGSAQLQAVPPAAAE